MRKGDGRGPKRSTYSSTKRWLKRPERADAKKENGPGDGNNTKGHRKKNFDSSAREGGNLEEGGAGNSPTTAATKSDNHSGSGHPSGSSTQSPVGRPAAADDADAATGAAKKPADDEAAAAAAAARSMMRPANFGVGAVEVAGGGGGQCGGGGGDAGTEEGVGLELPPIEEDQVYRREMAAMRTAGGEVRTHKACTGGGDVPFLEMFPFFRSTQWFTRQGVPAACLWLLRGCIA